MSNSYQYGNYRCLEPLNSFPNSAWKIDNRCEIYDNELLIDVSLLNIDSNSFKQLYVECEGDTGRIKKRIYEIVNIRGKLHNPITGTGGILFGRVAEVGKNYPNKFNLKPGDEVISLSSLTLTPLYIKDIFNIDISSGQVSIEGKAILFPNSPLIKPDITLPINMLLAVLDEAGAVINSYNIVRPGNRVIILGASGKLGLMCAYAVRKKLGNNGTLIGVKSPRHDNDFKNNFCDIFDEIYELDILKPFEAFEKLDNQNKLFDVTINCTNILGSEVFSILCTREFGTIYLATLTNSYKILCSTVEGIAKDINILGYKGYSVGHADFTVGLLKEYPSLVRLLNKRLERIYEPEYLGSKISQKSLMESNILRDINLEEYVFESKGIRKALDNALKVASFDCTVLITGESGVGKEIIAKIIHKSSERNEAACVKLNCGSIPKNLLESELFGYEKGAFTGADKNGKPGFFEIASGGTIFLDEIGELPLDLQVKLLRVIQEKEIYRIGGLTPIHINIRIIAATNRNLQDLVYEGKFREDLYYRLNVFPIDIPPLRERREDIIPLINHFCRIYNNKFRLNKCFENDTLNYLTDYNWPGNIRELENLVQRLLISTSDQFITISEVIKSIPGTSGEKALQNISSIQLTLQEILENNEKEILITALEKYKTTRRMAKALGISQSTLVRKLRKHNL